MTRDSLEARLNFADRQIRKREKRKDWGETRFSKSESDYRFLRNAESGFNRLTLCCTIFVIYWGSDFVGDYELDFAGFMAICSAALLIYSVFRAAWYRWSLEAFEQFAPQSVAQLKNRIAEQGEPLKP